MGGQHDLYEAGLHICASSRLGGELRGGTPEQEGTKHASINELRREDLGQML